MGIKTLCRTLVFNLVCFCNTQCNSHTAVHIKFEAQPIDFSERLSALVPPPEGWRTWRVTSHRR